MNAQAPIKLDDATPLAGVVDVAPATPSTPAFKDRFSTVIAAAGHIGVQSDDPWLQSLGDLLEALDPRRSDIELLEALPAEIEVGDEAMVLHTLVNLGYSANPVTVAINDIDVRLLPALFVTGDEQPFVIVRGERDDDMRILAPGHPGSDSAPLSPLTTGSLWVFRRYDENREPTSRFMRSATGQSWFSALLGRFRALFFQIMVAGVFVSLIALGIPLLIMMIYDRVIGVDNPAALPMLAAGLAITVAFEWWMRSLRSSSLGWFTGRLDYVVGTKIFEQILDLPPERTAKASVSSQIARIKTFEAVREFFASPPFSGLLDAPFIVVGLVAMAAIAGPLVFVPIGATLLYAILFLVMRARIKPAVHIAARASSARQQFAIDALEKLTDIRAQGLTQKWSEKYRALSGREITAQRHLKWLSTVAETAAQTLTTLTAVATVAVGVHLVWAGTITGGALVASILLVWRILAPLYWFSMIVARAEQLKNSNIQISELMDLEGETDSSRQSAAVSRIMGAVALQDVSLRYSESSGDAIRGLSFSANPGDFVALTGPNGSGKGNVLKLIQALERPASGVVQIDGFDVRQLNPRVIRRHIASIPERPEFFRGTIAQNIRLAQPFATDADVWEALDLAVAGQEVRLMENQERTLIGGTDGITLDPNLAMRLALARAYLHPGKILLIDDLPNSVLTGTAGSNLKTYLAKIKGQRTVIYLSHREDFLRLADTIVYLRPQQKPIVDGREAMLRTLSKQGEAL